MDKELLDPVIGYEVAGVSIASILEMEYFSNTVQNYLIAIGLFIVIYLGVWAFKRIVINRLVKTAKNGAFRYLHQFLLFLDNIGGLTYGAVALYVSTKYLVLPEIFDTIIRAIVMIIVVYEVMKVLQQFVTFVISKKLIKQSEPEGKQLMGLVKPIVVISLWTIAIVTILSNLGVDVTSLVASLGIGGIAIALAAQNILGDLFNSFSIYLDQPFKVGDFVVVGPNMGTVKKVGIKTTRIQAIGGEELVIPNSDLTSARIQNFKRMERRRIAFNIGVTYSTPPAKLKKIGKMCKDIIDPMKDLDFDRAHFKSFGDSSLNYEIVYFINSADYLDYIDAQQKINISLLEELGKEGIEMAFPTRVVHMINEEKDYEYGGK